MPVAPELRSLQIDIPAQPEVLVRLSLLMARDDAELSAMSALIEQDMALASAVLRAVNSSMYGLNGRVQSVQQALTYLGMREVAGITFEMGLRAAFPPAPELDVIWQRAARRGQLMGRLGQLLHIDPWSAHSAGLFEECGKAVLYRHAPAQYPALLRTAGSDVQQLCAMEHAMFGVSYDALGAALCETWGLAPAATASVRHHLALRQGRDCPAQLERRGVAVVGALAWALTEAPQQLEPLALALAPLAQLDELLVQRALVKLEEEIQQAQRHGRT
ncbi:HDOD domain-containing protein [Roseateles sp. BYS180W]|uniref:HDOD domain-containing protein n=1 Tax=Roseateles rivi TaxID=3299028 RepID=A0ABW7FUP4_9BURK